MRSITPREKARRRLQSFKRLCEDFGVAYTTARDRAFAGELPYYKIGTAWYAYPEDFAAFIERSAVRVGR